MFISRKGQYSMFFLIELAINRENPVTVRVVSKKYDLSEKYLEQIATQLSRSGAVRVIRGSKGGYYLAKNAEEYTVRYILDSVEGKRNSVDVNFDQVSDSNRVLNSVVYSVGEQLDTAVNDVLSNITLADLVNSYESQLNYSYVI